MWNLRVDVDQCLGHVTQPHPPGFQYSFRTATAPAGDRRREKFQIVGDPLGFIACSAEDGTMYLSYLPTQVVAEPGERLICRAADGTEVRVSLVPRRAKCDG